MDIVVGLIIILIFGSPIIIFIIKSSAYKGNGNEKFKIEEDSFKQTKEDLSDMFAKGIKGT